MTVVTAKFNILLVVVYFIFYFFFGANVYCTVALPWTAAVTLLGDIYIYTYVHTLPTPTAETTPTVLERTVKM